MKKIVAETIIKPGYHGV